MVRPQDHPLLEQALHRLQRDGQSAFDLPLRGQDGSYRWYQIAAHLDAKQPAGSDSAVFAVLQDIDAPKRSQLAHAEALRADRKSVVEGKSVSVRVGLGGRRILKKKKSKNITTPLTNK